MVVAAHPHCESPTLSVSVSVLSVLFFSLFFAANTAGMESVQSRRSIAFFSSQLSKTKDKFPAKVKKLNQISSNHLHNLFCFLS